MDETARLERLLELMREHDLDALKIRVGEAKYELVRREPASAPPALPSALPAAPAAGASTPPPSAAGPGANVKRVTAPVVGVFYRAPSPGAEPFVSLGERVTAGQVVCILEAMKMMNEIVSDHAGVVARIIPENGELVSLGEDLLWIEP